LLDGAERGDPRSADPHIAVELRPSLFAALSSLGEQQRAVVCCAHLRAHPGLAAIFAASDSTV
jgi:hypothetical protein